MDQIVNHKGYWCKKVPHGWKARHFNSPATGQRETIVWRKYLYIPQDDIDNPDLLVNEIDQTGTLMDEERKERQRIASRAAARARAGRKCRHRIKSHDLRQMLTGTYRENMTDFDRVRRDFAAFMRIMKRIIPGFRCVYAFELQERGAWHWHAAIDKLPPWIEYDGGRVRSYDLARRMWLRVVGKFEGKDNGTVNVDGHNKTKVGTPAKWTRPQSLARIAAYVSKYITKEVGDGIEGRNMWGSTQHLDTDKPVTFDIEEMAFADVISCLFDLPPGHRVVTHRSNKFSSFWMLYTEPDSDKLPPS